MVENRENRPDASRADDLSPALRRAVEEVLRDPMPDSVTSRALAAARQVGRRIPDDATPTLRRPPPAVWRVLAVAASIGLLAGLAWWRWGGSPGSPTVSRAPSSVRPGHVQPIPDGPETREGDRRPSLWAYRQAARQSADALDAALDRDARSLLRPEPRPVHAGASPASIQQTL